MNKDNKKSWQIDEKGFPVRGFLSEKIKFLLNYGVLAPSSHNSQPWAFRIRENYLEIYADLKRKLREADREGRMLFLGLGCLITNLKVAADYFGLACSSDYRFDGSLVAIMNFWENNSEKTADKKTLDYFQAITKRCSNRNKYKDLAISSSDLQGLESLNQDAILKVNFVTEESLKSQIAEISSWAMGKVMSDRQFRGELAYWLRSNLTLKRDGMPGEGHGMSLIVSFLAPFILKHINVSKVEAKKEELRILNFPTVGIISSAENNPKSWLGAGELLELILLAAQSKGLDSVIRVASIEVPEAREKLKNTLHLGNFSPQMLFGLGCAEKEAPHSPRRKIEEIIM